jgi:hypothetical protein
MVRLGTPRWTLLYERVWDVLRLPSQFSSAECIEHTAPSWIRLAMLVRSMYGTIEYCICETRAPCTVVQPRQMDSHYQIVPYQYSAIAIRSSWRLLTCARVWWEERAVVQTWSTSTHRLTTYRASISISVALSGRGTERLRVISRSWRVRGRFVSVFRTFERCGAVQQQFGGSQAKDSCNNRRITVGITSYCMIHCELAGSNILPDRNSTRIWSEMCKLVQSDSESPSDVT